VVLPATLLVPGVLLAGCAGAEDSGSPAHRMRTWADGTSFGAGVGSLKGDSAAVAAGYRDGRALSSLPSACNALALDAQNANDSLPSPDAALTQQLASAYQLYYEAGTACYSSQSSATMRKVTAQRQHADRLLTEATATAWSGRCRGAGIPTPTTGSAAGSFGPCRPGSTSWGAVAPRDPTAWRATS
jgi:hypothetical protein